MKYILFKDGFGFAVYEPNDGSVWHTYKHPEATEAELSDWSEVIGMELADYHQILAGSSLARLKASGALSNDQAHPTAARASVGGTENL